MAAFFIRKNQTRRLSMAGSVALKKRSQLPIKYWGNRWDRRLLCFESQHIFDAGDEAAVNIAQLVQIVDSLCCDTEELTAAAIGGSPLIALGDVVGLLQPVNGTIGKYDVQCAVASVIQCGSQLTDKIIPFR